MSPPKSRFALEIDAGVVLRARDGDLNAFGEIYHRFEKPVYNLALRMLGEPAEAQEVLQDTFIKCHDCLHQYRGDAPFWGWLRRVATTTALMRIRANSRRGSSVDVDESLIGQSLTASDDHQSANARVELEHALAELTETARTVVWLYHMEGYSHEEIAGMWGKSVSFSKSQLSRAHLKLRDLLSPPGHLSSNGNSLGATT